MSQMSWLAATTLWSITLIRDYGTGGSTIFLSWSEFSASPALSPSCKNTNLLPRKTSRRCGHGRGSSRFGAQTFAQELALAKALKPSKKFTVKTFVAGVEAAGKKTFFTTASGSGMTHSPKHMLNLFGSDSSMSDGEAIPVERPCKHSKETSSTKDISKSSASKGIFK
jgi:hypothetical protein